MATTVSFTVPIRQASPLVLPRRDVMLAAGEDTDLQITVKETDGGAAVDITGAAINFRMTRPKRLDIELEITGSIVTAASGILKVALTAADTLKLAGEYWFDVRVVLAARTFVTPRGVLIFAARAGEAVYGADALASDYT